MTDLRVIMLDFDGVLVESVGIKDQAFKKLFVSYPEKLDEIMSYHLAHNATIRFEKFQYIYDNILKIKYTENIKNNLSKQFSDYVVQNIIDCPSVKGSIEFLDYFYSRVSLYVISTNPPKELAKIIQARGLTKYFKKVYAFPWKKADAMKDILEKENLRNNQAIYIGDSPEDRKSSAQVNIPFIGRISNKDIGGDDIYICQDLFEVKNIILKREEDYAE